MAEPTAHTEAPAGHAAFPPFQSEHFPSQLLWLTVSFVLLYVLMSKIALPRIGSILADRSKRHRRRHRGGATLEGAVGRRACRLREGARRRARPRPSDRQRDAREAGGARPRQRSKRLEAQLHERLAAARADRSRRRATAAMGNVRAIAAETAAAIVQRLIGKAPAAHEVAAALGEANKTLRRPDA